MPLTLAQKFINVGTPVQLAIELARQLTVGQYSAQRLMECDMSQPLSRYLATSLASGSFDPVKANGLGMVAAQAALIGTDGGFILPLIEWDTVNFPLTIRKSGSRWASNFDRTRYIPDSVFVTTYYVDIARPDNNGNGLTPATAKKSIHAAVTAGNATAQPYRVLVSPGSYDRANGISNSGAVFPTQTCGIISNGGSVITGTFDILAWPGTTDPTYTNSYVVARANVARVFDIASTNEFGDYVELTKQTTATIVNNTNGWAQDGGNVVVRRPDGAPVTNANTRVYVNTANARFATSNARLYLKGIAFEGGSAGDQNPLIVTGALNTVVVGEDCSFKYGGSNSSFLRDGVSIDGSSGLFAFIRCRVSANSKDGFNAHWLVDSTRKVFVLTENCVGRDDGKFGSASNNEITGHETVSWVDINGDYAYNHGGTVRFVNDSRLVAYGSLAAKDQGDGGQTIIVGWNTADTASFWLWDCSADMASSADASVFASSGASPIRLRGFKNITGTMGTVGVSNF